MRSLCASAAAAVLLGAVACDGGSGGGPDLTDDARACVERLRALHRGLVDYTRSHGAPPSGSGVAFFGALIAEGTWPANREHVALLSCPGVDDDELEGSELPPSERWRDLSRIDGRWSAYAGRDQECAPLARLPGPGTEALIACDNHGTANHAGGVTNALFADGSVVTYELAVEIEAGRVPPDATRIDVGPDSPIPALRVLRADAP